ncbi:MAG: hypothetical protein ACRDKY_07790 [Solirubrobacteraceae bacterium]
MGVRRLLLAAVLLTGLCWPATAPAATNQEAIMMDDDLLLYRGDHRRAQAMTRMKQIGVDSVRVTVLWSVVAQGANMTDAEIKRLKSASARKKARQQRARFDPDNPRTYPRRNWDPYDNLLKEAAKLRMRVFFSVTGPGPPFTHRKAPKSQRLNFFSFKPVPSRYREFVEALGTRYSGKYKDENALKQALPRVTLWSLWNEPNQPGWLSPQWEKRDGQMVPAAPALYRALHKAGTDALMNTGHGGDTIMLAETAPLGSSKRGPRNAIRPVPFLRELVCLNATGAPYVGADAARRNCADFAKGPLKATAFAHHAYTKKRAPSSPVGHPEELTMANLGTWGPLLDRLSAQSSRKIPAGLPIFITEFGYESNPPDPRNGIPLLKQAEYNQLGDFLAYNNPRVRANTQFLLRDSAPLKKYKRNSRQYWFTYQSGLFTNKDKNKPAVFAYLVPFVAYRKGPAIAFWGQLRFRPNTSKDVTVIQWRASPSAAWRQLGPARPTSVLGFFTSTAAPPAPNAEYRAVWVNPATGKITASSLPDKP